MLPRSARWQRDQRGSRAVAARAVARDGHRLEALPVGERAQPRVGRDQVHEVRGARARQADHDDRARDLDLEDLGVAAQQVLEAQPVREVADAVAAARRGGRARSSSRSSSTAASQTREARAEVVGAEVREPGAAARAASSSAVLREDSPDAARAHASAARCDVASAPGCARSSMRISAGAGSRGASELALELRDLLLEPAHLPEVRGARASSARCAARLASSAPRCAGSAASAASARCSASTGALSAFFGAASATGARPARERHQLGCTRASAARRRAPWSSARGTSPGSVSQIARADHGDLAVALADLELGRQPDLAHHAARRRSPAFIAATTASCTCSTAPRMRSSSARISVAPDHRVEVADAAAAPRRAEQHVERLDVAERVAVAVAADRHQVREVPEQRAEHVAGEADPMLRQPDQQRVLGLGARRRRSARSAAPPSVEREAVLERDVGRRTRLRRRRRAARPPCRRRGCSPRTRTCCGARGRARGARRRPGARGCSRAPPPACRARGSSVDAAHVVDVTLRQHDVAERARVDRVEPGLVHRRLEAHAGVDHHAALARHDEVRVRVALREPDEVVDLLAGGRVVAGRIAKASGRERHRGSDMAPFLARPARASIAPAMRRPLVWLWLGAPLGAALGIGLFTVAYAKALSYVSDEPEACVNCHIMREQYEGWLRGPAPRGRHLQRLPRAARLLRQVALEGAERLPSQHGVHAPELPRADPDHAAQRRGARGELPALPRRVRGGAHAARATGARRRGCARCHAGVGHGSQAEGEIMSASSCRRRGALVSALAIALAAALAAGAGRAAREHPHSARPRRATPT